MRIYKVTHISDKHDTFICFRHIHHSAVVTGKRLTRDHGGQYTIDGVEVPVNDKRKLVEWINKVIEE